MARPPDPTVGDGLLLVDKPPGMTSHDVVAACRRICGTRKVGHAGTLDPMATGLLLVGVNRATRLLTFLVGCDKTYEATIRLGQSTLTDDAEGEVLTETRATGVTSAGLAAAIAALTGEISQVPSAVSAVKVAGVRSYARVRSGEEVALAPREVRVSRFEVLGRRDDAVPGCVDLDVVVEVSAGTYVRALARDLGAALGVGGHLVALRRTRVGSFDVADGATLGELEAARANAAEGTSGLPLRSLAAAAAAVLPVQELDDEAARKLSHGVATTDPDEGLKSLVAAVDRRGNLVAVLDRTGPKVKVKVIFANGWSSTS